MVPVCITNLRGECCVQSVDLQKRGLFFFARLPVCLLSIPPQVPCI